MIDAHAAWQIFLAASKKSMDDNGQFSSPHKKHLYQIVEVDSVGVKVKTKEATTSRKPIIRIGLFTNSMERVNDAEGRLAKTKMCNGNVLFETIIVELLPMLSWDKSKHHIIETLAPLVTPTTAISAEKIKQTAIREIIIRRGQAKLRAKLLGQYNNSCCITGCTIREILHAAHITPYSLTYDNESTNALLLRADIHDLYDAYLLGINPETLKIEISNQIKSTYGHLNGIVIKGRADKQPLNTGGMLKRWQEFKKR